jgi:hypothetical protein
MITTQTPEKQTGAFSRIQRPFAPLSPSCLCARTRRGMIKPPKRNLLAGGGGWEPISINGASTGILGRIKAWFRGEI